MTEIGRIEFRMLLYMDLINEAPIEAMFEEYSEATFGGKIKIFEKWCEHGGVPERHKAEYADICRSLKALLDIRNMLVHAETWEGAFRGKPHQPYRVAIIKGNLDYLDDLEHTDHGDNVFDTDRVREAAKACRRLLGMLKNMHDERTATAEPYVSDQEDSEWPTT